MWFWQLKNPCTFLKHRPSNHFIILPLGCISFSASICGKSCNPNLRGVRFFVILTTQEPLHIFITLTFKSFNNIDFELHLFFCVLMCGQFCSLRLWGIPLFFEILTSQDAFRIFRTMTFKSYRDLPFGCTLHLFARQCMVNFVPQDFKSVDL